MPQQWATRQQQAAQTIDHGEKIKKNATNKLNRTLFDNINRGKFTYNSDAEFSVVPKTGNSKLREDIKKNLHVAQEDFFGDFHQDIEKKSRKMMNSVNVENFTN